MILGPRRLGIANNEHSAGRPPQRNRHRHHRSLGELPGRSVAVASHRSLSSLGNCRSGPIPAPGLRVPIHPAVRMRCRHALESPRRVVALSAEPRELKSWSLPSSFWLVLTQRLWPNAFLLPSFLSQRSAFLDDSSFPSPRRAAWLLPILSSPFGDFFSRDELLPLLPFVSAWPILIRVSRLALNFQPR